MTNYQSYKELLPYVFYGFDREQGNVAKEVRQTLREIEHPGFTLRQAFYWVCTEYATPGSKASLFIESNFLNYTPSENETIKSLVETDADFERLYNQLDILAQGGELVL